MRPDNGIDRGFYDLHNYAVCRALCEVISTEGAEKFWRRVGEIAFDEIGTKIRIEKAEPVTLMKRMAKYLVSTGYMKKLVVTEIAPKEVVVDMWGGPASSSRKLIEENCAPSHTMSNLMFAALKKLCGIEVEISHLEIDEESQEEAGQVDWGSGAHGKEKWLLSKIRD